MTLRLLALALLLVGAAVARNLTGGVWIPGAAVFALGFALGAGVLAGEVVARLHLPRLTGYLVIGVVCGPHAAGLVADDTVRELRFVNNLAITLIAFIAGLELSVTKLTTRAGALLRLGAVVLVVCYAGLSTALWLAWPWLPVAPESAGLIRVLQVLLLTTVVVSFSPTVTIAVIAETRARGALTELVVALVVLADLALILMFTLVLRANQLVLDRTTMGGAPFVLDVGWKILGSLAVGAAGGALLTLYVRRVDRGLPFALLALCAALSAAGSQWHLEPLLIGLASGLFVENVGSLSARLGAAVALGAFPVLVVFFVVAGMTLRFDALATVGLPACLVAIWRAACIWAGTRLGTRVSGVDPSHGHLAWMGLVSQAGVTIGMTVIVAETFPDWGGQFQTLMLALVALHELVGPVLFKAALTRAQEVP